MAKQGAAPPKTLPPECGDLARIAFDVLMGGFQALELGPDPSREELNNWLAQNKRLLAAFLRSDQPIPDAMRSALADALDRQGDPPVYLNLTMGRKRPQRVLRILEDRERAKLGLQVFEEARAAGSDHAYAMELAAEAAGMSVKNFAAHRADLNASRRRSAEIKRAMDDGKSIQEIYELMNSPAERKRGPEPKHRV